MAWGHDSEFDIAQSGGGLKGIGGSEMPMPDRRGKGEGGPSKRKPKAPVRDFMRSAMLSSAAKTKGKASFAASHKTAALPGAKSNPFTKGKSKKSGLGSIGPV